MLVFVEKFSEDPNQLIEEKINMIKRKEPIAFFADSNVGIVFLRS